MVSVAEAYSIVQSHPFTPKIESIAINECLHRVLGEDLIADRDFPPFDRVAMDGIAIRFDEFAKGRSSFGIEGIAAAGQCQETLKDPTHCYEVMTGASLPINTDTVIQYEDISSINGVATINISEILKNQNVHPQAQDANQGDVLLTSGTTLSPIEIALVATVGKLEVKVKSLPRFAVISTGDELVGIDEIPKPHQIRRSNSFTLQAALKALNCESSLHHLPDQKEKIAKKLAAISEDHDAIILSGGVSKGKFDYVPEVLKQLGIKKHFHKVKQKPGKPFWFGSSQNKTFFALPGNPVSTTVCFYKYVKPWLNKSLGSTIDGAYAELNSDFNLPSNLTYFLEVSVRNENGKLIANPHPGGGSGDFINLKKANGFMELHAHQNNFKKGEVFPIHLFR